MQKSEIFFFFWSAKNKISFYLEIFKYAFTIFYFILTFSDNTEYLKQNLNSALS